MRPLVRRIDLYLGRTVLLSMLGAGVVLLGFDLILALVNELDEIGEGGYTLSHAASTASGSSSHHSPAHVGIAPLASQPLPRISSTIALM